MNVAKIAAAPMCLSTGRRFAEFATEKPADREHGDHRADIVGPSCRRRPAGNFPVTTKRRGATATNTIRTGTGQHADAQVHDFSTSRAAQKPVEPSGAGRGVLSRRRDRGRRSWAKAVARRSGESASKCEPASETSLNRKDWPANHANDRKKQIYFFYGSDLMRAEIFCRASVLLTPSVPPTEPGPASAKN